MCIAGEAWEEQPQKIVTHAVRCKTSKFNGPSCRWTPTGEESEQKVIKDYHRYLISKW